MLEALRAARRVDGRGRIMRLYILTWDTVDLDALDRECVDILLHKFSYVHFPLI